MNRKYEGLLSVAILGVALVGCRKGENQASVESGSEDQIAVKTPLGTSEGNPGTNGPVSNLETPAGKAGASTSTHAGTPSSMSSTAYPSGIRRPPMPAADEVVTGKYEAPGGSVAEVEGVCSIKEDSVACWDSTGRNYSDLAKRVEEALTRNDRFGGMNRISFAYKKKNRVIITKTTQPRMVNHSGPTASIGMMSVGDNQFGGDYINLDINRHDPSNANGPWSNYSARTVSVDPSATTTSVRFSVTQPVPEAPTLQLRKGASCSIAGAKLTVVSIKKGVHAPRSGGSVVSIYDRREAERPMWTIQVKLTGGRSKVQFGASVSGYVDEKGRMVTQDEYMKAMMRTSEEARRVRPGRRPPTPRYTPIYMSESGGYGMPHGNGNPSSDRYFILNADPAAVKQITVRASSTKQVEIKGVRLDPR